MSPDDLEDLRAQAQAQRLHETRRRARFLAHPNPRDPDYPGDPPDTDHQYTGQQPLDLD